MLRLLCIFVKSVIYLSGLIVDFNFHGPFGVFKFAFGDEYY